MLRQGQCCLNINIEFTTFTANQYGWRTASYTRTLCTIGAKMYNFFYYFIYTFAKRRNPAPESYAAGGVLFMIISHLALIAGLIRYFLGYTLPSFSDNYGTNKLMLLPIFFLIYWLTANYYERISDRIVERYNAKYRSNHQLYSAKNIALFCFSLIAPLTIGIYFVNLST